MLIISDVISQDRDHPRCVVMSSDPNTDMYEELAFSVALL